jgi:hypothetical protein
VTGEKHRIPVGKSEKKKLLRRSDVKGRVVLKWAIRR